MNEEICCDDLAQDIRNGVIEFDQDNDIRIVDQDGRTLIENVTFCLHCGEALI